MEADTPLEALAELHTSIGMSPLTVHVDLVDLLDLLDDDWEAVFTRLGELKDLLA